MKDIRICFIGDSFVNGTGDPEKLGWAGRLCAAAENETREITCYNLGVRRETSSDILARWEKECAARLPEGSDNRLVFSFGVNDCVMEGEALRVQPDETVANARRILTRAAKKYPVLLIGPPPIDGAEINERIQNLDRSLRALCSETGIPYLSIFEPLAALPVWNEEVASNDGAHPRSAGYVELARLIASWEAWWF